MTKWPLVKLLELKLRQFVEQQSGALAAGVPARQFVANRSDQMAELVINTINKECVGSAPGGPHYFVSGVVATYPSNRLWRKTKYFQIMEEKDGQQVCIAGVPFTDPQEGYIAARTDALNIAKGLNLQTWLTQKAIQDP